ncbi:MAG TPA: ribosome maturation factor RimP [Burkholderiales bacterium]|nr:ribosome maturation factor RimP [Burkholderiales bacterium]
MEIFEKSVWMRYTPADSAARVSLLGQKAAPGGSWMRPLCLRGSDLDVENVVEPVVAGMGYELVDLHASKGGLLRLFIDKPGGVSLGDCEAVSRQLSRVLEVEGVAYERLEVSSPGLDRPLRKARDFARFAGRKAEVRMRFADGGGRRRFVGVLRGVQADRVSLDVDGTEVALALEGIERARLIPEL